MSLLRLLMVSVIRRFKGLGGRDGSAVGKRGKASDPFVENWIFFLFSVLPSFLFFGGGDLHRAVKKYLTLLELKWEVWYSNTLNSNRVY